MKNNITKMFCLHSVIVDKLKVEKDILIYVRSQEHIVFVINVQKLQRKYMIVKQEK